MATSDPFSAMRELAAARPPPAVKDREREGAAEKQAREEGSRHSPARRLLNFEAAVLEICNHMISTEHCPYRWEINPFAKLARIGGQNRHDSFKTQLAARGFDVVSHYEDTRIAPCPCDPSVPMPDVPAWLTADAHARACSDWKVQTSAPFLAKFVKHARNGQDSPPIRCGSAEYVLIPYMNEELAKIPFDHKGVRSILVTYPQTTWVNGICGESYSYALVADIRDATYEK